MKLQLIALLLLTTVFTVSVNAQDSAANIMEKALSQAKAENKHVFVKYQASWCGWCKKMSGQMKSDELKKFFDDNYVTAELVVMESPKNKQLENPGSMDVLTQHGGSTSGLPFWVILDKNGKLLEDSFNAKKENLGCPATKEEVDEFIGKLKRTSALNESQLAEIATVFAKK